MPRNNLFREEPVKRLLSFYFLHIIRLTFVCFFLVLDNAFDVGNNPTVDMDTEFGWCPECEQFTTHYGIQCAGCDMTDEEIQEVIEKENRSESKPSIDDLAEGRVIGESDGSENTESPAEMEWEEDEWVVCSGGDPVFSASQKKDCVKYIEEESGIDNLTTTRKETGLYLADIIGDTYWIGRPEGYEKAGPSLTS